MNPPEDPPDDRRFPLKNLLLALLPITVMAWTIADVAMHAFNRWTMLRTVCLVVFSIPAMIGALLGGAIGLRIGSQLGLGCVLLAMVVGMMVMRIILA